MVLSNQFLNSPTFKLILLTGMVLQNSSAVLVGRYTRSSVPPDQLYAVNHLLLTIEIGKIMLSCCFEHYTTKGQLMKSIQTNIIDRPYDTLKIMAPALLYFMQNSLMYVALSNLTAPIFQVTYQAKLVTTAIVSVLMLNRRYSFQQWICLVTLSLGVAIVVLGEAKGDTDDDKKADNGQNKEHKQSVTVGLLAVTIACMCSALAGVYFEKVVKAPSASGSTSPPVSVWMRNVQLAFFTIVVALLQGIWQGQKASGTDTTDDTAGSKGYFHGFTGWVWLLVALQAGGGLLVAAIIKYADNVLKGLATGVSVCFATFMSWLLLNTHLSGQFFVGASMIMAAVYFFSNPIKNKDSSSSISPTPPSRGNSQDDMKPILPK